MSAKEARAVLSNLQASVLVEALHSQIENHIIPGDPMINIDQYCQTSIERRQDTPRSGVHAQKRRFGGFDANERLVREFANKPNVAVVSVTYTPTPEAQYPVQIEQVYATMRWAVENGMPINVDPSRLSVIDNDVEGNMATSGILQKSVAAQRLVFKSSFIQ